MNTRSRGTARAVTRICAAALIAASALTVTACSANRGSQLAAQFGAYLERHPAVSEAHGSGDNALPFIGSLTSGGVTLGPDKTVDDAFDAYAWARDYSRWDDLRSFYVTFADGDHEVIVSSTVARDLELDRDMFAYALELRETQQSNLSLWQDAERVLVSACDPDLAGPFGDSPCPTPSPGMFGARVDADDPATAIDVFAATTAAGAESRLAYVTVVGIDRELVVAGAPGADFSRAVVAYEAVAAQYPIWSARLEEGQIQLTLAMEEDPAVAALIADAVGPEFPASLAWRTPGI